MSPKQSRCIVSEDIGSLSISVLVYSERGVAECKYRKIFLLRSQNKVSELSVFLRRRIAASCGVNPLVIATNAYAIDLTLCGIAPVGSAINEALSSVLSLSIIRAYSDVNRPLP